MPKVVLIIKTVLFSPFGRSSFDKSFRILHMVIFTIAKKEIGEILSLQKKKDQAIKELPMFPSPHSAEFLPKSFIRRSGTDVGKPIPGLSSGSQGRCV